MEIPNRTYQKHKTEGKITIKHFVNKELKPIALSKGDCYPVYLMIIAAQQSIKLKSIVDIHNYFPVVENYNFQEDTFLNRPYKCEVEDALFLLKKMKPFESENFRLSNFKQVYHDAYTLTLSQLTDKLLKEEIKKEIDYSLNYDADLVADKPYAKEIAEILEKQTNWKQNSADYIFRKGLDLVKPARTRLSKKYSSDIWIIDAFEKIVNYRQKSGYNSHFPVRSVYDDTYPIDYGKRYIQDGYDLIDFLEGTFQKDFIAEFGDSEKNQKLFNDLSKLIFSYYPFLV